MYRNPGTHANDLLDWARSLVDEKGARPRRTTHALDEGNSEPNVAWRAALRNVKPDWLIRWHRRDPPLLPLAPQAGGKTMPSKGTGAPDATRQANPYEKRVSRLSTREVFRCEFEQSDAVGLKRELELAASRQRRLVRDRNPMRQVAAVHGLRIGRGRRVVKDKHRPATHARQTLRELKLNASRVARSNSPRRSEAFRREDRPFALRSGSRIYPSMEPARSIRSGDDPAARWYNTCE